MKEVLLSLMRHGCYPPPKATLLTPSRALLASVERLVALEERQDDVPRPLRNTRLLELIRGMDGMCDHEEPVAGRSPELGGR